MKDKTKELLQKVKDSHDWEPFVPTKSGGTAFLNQSVCRICGMKMNWTSDPSGNSEPRYWFKNYDGKSLPLNIAAKEDCGI